MCFLLGQEQQGQEQEVACPWVISVADMGIQARTPRGCLMDRSWLESFVVPCHHSLFQHWVYINLPHKMLTCIRTVSHGQFGYIDLARYDTQEGTRDVYVKRPIQEEKAVAEEAKGDKTLYEPYLQEVVRQGLAGFGMPDHVPRVLEVFRLRNGSVCFAMEQVEGGMTLDGFLLGLRPGPGGTREFSEVIIQLLYQVTMMVWFMNDGLGVNHRDLQPSNFLLRKEAVPVSYSFSVGLEEPVTWTTSFHLSLIDFGFACAGSMDTQRARLSLSTIYSRRDPCPKDGRDLFLFLGHLYSDCYSWMSAPLRRWFEHWLAIPGSDFCGFLRKDKETSKRWLYFLSGSEEVFQLRCCPAVVIPSLRLLERECFARGG
jgi:serine/threonine protein kinase